MSAASKIEWTDATWNPVGGCSRLSPGCEHCYAEQRVAPRLHAQDHPVYKDVVSKHANGAWRFTGKMTAAPDYHPVWSQPARWRKPRVIFPCSMSDLFHESRPEADIDRVFAAMAVAPQHRYLVLTKRGRRMREYIEAKIRQAPEWISLPAIEGRVLLPYEGGWPTYIWLGVSVEDQQRADERIPDLLATPAALRFLSVEPILGHVDLRQIAFRDGDPRHKFDALTGQALLYGTGINGNPDIVTRMTKPIHPPVDWVIAGGESGPGARPAHPDWFRSIRDQCAADGVPFFFKQWGAWLGTYPSDRKPEGDPRCHARPRSIHEWNGGVTSRRVGKAAAGRELDGRTHDAMPEPAR